MDATYYGKQQTDQRNTIQLFIQWKVIIMKGLIPSWSLAQRYRLQSHVTNAGDKTLLHKRIIILIVKLKAKTDVASISYLPLARCNFNEFKLEALISNVLCTSNRIRFMINLSNLTIYNYVHTKRSMNCRVLI